MFNIFILKIYVPFYGRNVYVWFQSSATLCLQCKIVKEKTDMGTLQFWVNWSITLIILMCVSLNKSLKLFALFFFCCVK